MSDFISPSGESAKRQAEAIRRIRGWISDSGAPGSDGIVHVAALRWREPECPECETVITLMFSSPSLDKSVKFSKSPSELSREEIITAITSTDLVRPPTFSESP